jgi:hypothetical protein
VRTANFAGIGAALIFYSAFKKASLAKQAGPNFATKCAREKFEEPTFE